MAGGKKHNGQKSSKIKSYHFIESKKARLTKGHSSRDLKGRTVKVCKCMGREKFWLEKGQVQRPWGRNMLGAGCAKKEQSKEPRAEKERRQRQEVPSEREERLGRQSLSTATAGSQAFTLREKGILLRRALLRTEVVYSLLF